MKIMRNDQVVIIAGDHKGKTGKVLTVQLKAQTVVVEGLGLITRHLKPSQAHPKGAVKEIHRPIHISKVALLVNSKPARVGYSQKADGSKVRVARNQGNKEIK